jgi:hypothetical protein
LKGKKEEKNLKEREKGKNFRKGKGKNLKKGKKRGKF